jgi:hypothetical protein
MAKVMLTHENNTVKATRHLRTLDTTASLGRTYLNSHRQNNYSTFPYYHNNHRHYNGDRVLFQVEFIYYLGHFPQIISPAASGEASGNWHLLVREVCKDTGREIPMVDDSPAMDGLQISLDSGEGRLFVIQSK